MHQARRKTKTMPSEIGFPTLTSDASLNQKKQWVDTWPHDTVRWYWSADTLFWQLSIDQNIDAQSVFSWALKVVRKCESQHWFSCGADSHSGGRVVIRCTVTWLPNFLRWVDLVSYGASLWPPKHWASVLSTELRRTHGERGHILGSYLTRILHTARISNVKIILYGETMKAGKRAFQSSYTNIMNKINLYNDVNAMRTVIGCWPWSIGVHIHGWCHGKLVFFVFFNNLRMPKLQEIFTTVAMVSSVRETHSKSN